MVLRRWMDWRLVPGVLQLDHGLADCGQVHNCSSQMGMADVSPSLSSTLTDILGQGSSVLIKKSDFWSWGGDYIFLLVSSEVLPR